MNQKERFLTYLRTCVKSTRATDSNPLLLGGNAPKDYARFLESDKLFDYNPTKWAHITSMYDITNHEEALKIFNQLISDKEFLKRDKEDNQGWRRGAISHYICFLNAEHFFIDSKSNKKIDISIALPLQQIYYGAPGTGKSFHVDEVCKKYEHFRTTFHPDSDYSTFVGCYKPSMEKEEKTELFSAEDLIEEFRKVKASGEKYYSQIFGVKYWESLKELSKDDIYLILKYNNEDTTLKQEIDKGIALGKVFKKKTEDSKIVYKFTPQAFTNAYIKAWELHESNTPVFLVVEEINRGNCAQIFGDLFQLLDRNDEGYSTYEITPDTDLQDYISQQGLNISGVTDSDGKDISAEIASGKLMKLPNNLHIWATMNTSDQSLFPIDSAFKRRWDWVYKPIKYSNESWKVVLKDGSWCKWTDLQQTLNDLIYDATESEDKMLGDWFVKAEKDEISEEVLVDKIIFYLWNDVAKVDAGKLFDLEVEKRSRKRKVIFSDFYEVDGTINSEVVRNWLKNIGIECSDAE